MAKTVQAKVDDTEMVRTTHEERTDRGGLYAMRHEYRAALASIDRPERQSMVRFTVDFASGFMPDRDSNAFKTVSSEKPHEIVNSLGSVAYHTVGSVDDRRLAVLAAASLIYTASEHGMFWGIPSAISEAARSSNDAKQVTSLFRLLEKLPESRWPDALGSLSRLPYSGGGRSEALDRLMLKFGLMERRGERDRGLRQGT